VYVPNAVLYSAPVAGGRMENIRSALVTWYRIAGDMSRETSLMVYAIGGIFVLDMRIETAQLGGGCGAHNRDYCAGSHGHLGGAVGYGYGYGFGTDGMSDRGGGGCRRCRRLRGKVSQAPSRCDMSERDKENLGVPVFCLV